MQHDSKPILAGTSCYTHHLAGNRVVEITPEGNTTYIPFPDFEWQIWHAPQLQIVLDPVEVAPSRTFTLTWAAYGVEAGACSYSGDWPEPLDTLTGRRQAQESRDGSYQYVLNCANEFGSTAVTRTLTVRGDPQPGESPAAEPQVPQALMKRSTYSLDGRAVALRQDGYLPGGPSVHSTLYMHGNHLGSLTVLSDENGDVVADTEARYYPFGAHRQTPAEPLNTDIGFTGHRHDNFGPEEVGLIYMGARYYDPTLRRFVSADTIVADGENSPAYNRFAYVYNNPVNMVDPRGHCAQDDDECWEWADRLWQEYGWRIDLTGITWTTEELVKLWNAGTLSNYSKGLCTFPNA